MTRKALQAFLAFALVACGAAPPAAGARRQNVRGPQQVVRGRLEDVKGRRRVALLVSKALVVDVRDPAAVAFEDYRRALAGSPPRQHTAAAREVAQRLNKYIRKYRGVTAAHSYDKADLVIVFKVTDQRPSAVNGLPYVWGKMYVLAVGGDRVPRLVWESRGDNSSADDATGDFLKALRAARGER